MRSRIVGLVASGCAWLACTGYACAGYAWSGQTKDAPNLLLLLTDDQPFDALGCAGHPFLQTPNIDTLAQDGVRFTRAFVTTPICAASRASILTGQYERAHGYTFGQPPLSEETVSASYPVLLREAGYRVGFVGKLGVRMSAEARERMFDDFASGTYPYYPAKDVQGPAAEPRRHLTERNVDRAIEFLNAQDGRPFCLSLSFQAPHAEDHNPEQYVWPDSCAELYGDVAIPEPALADSDFFDGLPEFLRTGFNRKRWHWRFDAPEKRERMVRGYCRMISGVDAGIGRLLAALHELELDDNTVVLFTADNGYFLGERGYAGKWTMHERSTRVPLIVRDPRRAAERRGESLGAMVLNIDLAPTLLELAGVAAPARMQGRSLRPLLAGEETTWREEVLTEHLWKVDGIPRTEALRTGRWKYIRYLDHPDYEELYDLDADPLEAHNLAPLEEHRERLEGLRSRLQRAAARAAG